MFENVDNYDQKSASFLINAVESGNLPGFDYLEFKRALKGLRDLNMDEVTAIRSAYTTGSTVGLTKAKLISSAQHYRQILLREKEQFDAALQKQMTQRVEGKRGEKAKIQERMRLNEAKIAELKIENEKLADKLTKSDGEIEEARVRIEETKEKFETTFKGFVSEIERDMDFLESLL